MPEAFRVSVTDLPRLDQPVLEPSVSRRRCTLILDDEPPRRALGEAAQQPGGTEPVVSPAAVGLLADLREVENALRPSTWDATQGVAGDDEFVEDFWVELPPVESFTVRVRPVFLGPAPIDPPPDDFADFLD